MLTNFYQCLIAANLTLVLFMGVYRFFLFQMTYFVWNRWYLLVSSLMSFTVPMLPIPNWFVTDSDWSAKSLYWHQNTHIQPLQLATSTTDAIFIFDWAVLLFLIYLAGVLYRMVKLLRSLWSIKQLINQSPSDEHGIYQQSSLPTFSFLGYIFWDTRVELATDEWTQVIHHEQIHIRQYHTIDILFIELISTIYWFNPVVYYIKKSLKLVHEYIVDTELLKYYSPHSYGKVLLKLAVNQSNMFIVNHISNPQIINRITMFTKPKSVPAQKLRFLIAFPIILFVLLLSSFWSERGPSNGLSQQKNGPIIRRISWKGNTLYTDAQLNQALGIKVGEPYDEVEFDSKMSAFEPTSVISLYMDKGYLFYNGKPEVKVIDNDNVEVHITIFEGNTVLIDAVLVKGNKKITKEQILNVIAIQKGELFSRTKLIKAQKTLSEMGYFNPKNIGINPLPKQTPKGWVTDIEFVVEEI